jgi:hypothetical protein
MKTWLGLEEQGFGPASTIPAVPEFRIGLNRKPNHATMHAVTVSLTRPRRVKEVGRL